MKKITIVLFGLLFGLLSMLAVFSGCSKAGDEDMALLGRSLSSSHVTSARARGAMPEAMAYNDAAVMHDSIRVEESSMEAANLSNDERKLIKRAHVRIRVENLEAADASISDMMSKYNAYAASMNAEENSRYYSLRVPSSLYDSFLAEMNGMGRMLHRSENTEDVTLRYYDLEGRLEMKRTLLRTFQSYLTRARTIEEILSVEARIAELQNDIEGTGMQLRHLSNRVDYATIDLNLVGPVAAGQTKNETFGERLKQLFGSFGSFLSTVAVIIVGIVVYGIPLMLLAALLFWVLFGRIGLLKKLWALVKGKKQE